MKKVREILPDIDTLLANTSKPDFLKVFLYYFSIIRFNFIFKIK